MVDNSIQNGPIGFVGIGEIGFGMATTVLDAGFTTIACDLKTEALNEFEDRGGETIDALDELGRTCRVVHVVVQNDDQVNEVVRGTSGLFDGFEDNPHEAVIIVHSSVRPTTCEALAADAPDNVSVMDAPVSGGRTRAEAGQLTLMVGAEDAVVEFCRPLLEVVAQEVLYVGGVGMGQAAKIAHNTTAISNLMTTVEGLRLGEAYGIERDTLLELFQNGAANSNMLRQYRDVFANEGDVDPERVERSAKLGQKDLYHALELARDADVELAGAAVASQKVPGYLLSYTNQR